MGRVIRGGSAAFAWEQVKRSPARRPSEEAAARLREALHTQIEERRRALDVELTVTEALVRMGELDAVADALEGQRLMVRAFSTDLRAVIADAVAEQPAERALNAWRDLPVPAADPSRGAAGLGSSSRPWLALALATAMLALVLVPGLRGQSLGMFAVREAREERAAWSQIHAARERLATFEPTQANAEEVAAQAREVHDQILSLPDSALASKALRAEIEGLLAEQSGALQDLKGNPDAKSLLAEVRALSASLGLGLPEPRIQPLTPASEEIPLPSALEDAPPQPAPEQLVPESEKPTSDLPLPEQPAPERPNPGSLDVRPPEQAPRPHPPEARAPDGPKPDLRP